MKTKYTHTKILITLLYIRLWFILVFILFLFLFLVYQTGLKRRTNETENLKDMDWRSSIALIPPHQILVSKTLGTTIDGSTTRPISILAFEISRPGYWAWTEMSMGYNMAHTNNTNRSKIPNQPGLYVIGITYIRIHVNITWICILKLTL